MYSVPWGQIIRARRAVSSGMELGFDGGNDMAVLLLTYSSFALYPTRWLTRLYMLWQFGNRVYVGVGTADKDAHVMLPPLVLLHETPGL
jgi:hypothetical protein